MPGRHHGSAYSNDNNEHRTSNSELRREATGPGAQVTTSLPSEFIIQCSIFDIALLPHKRSATPATPFTFARNPSRSPARPAGQPVAQHREHHAGLVVDVLEGVGVDRLDVVERRDFLAVDLQEDVLRLQAALWRCPGTWTPKMNTPSLRKSTGRLSNWLMVLTVRSQRGQSSSSPSTLPFSRGRQLDASRSCRSRSSSSLAGLVLGQQAQRRGGWPAGPPR